MADFPTDVAAAEGNGEAAAAALAATESNEGAVAEAAASEAPAAALSNEDEDEASAAAGWLAEAAGKGSVPAWVAKSASWAVRARMKPDLKAAAGVTSEAAADASVAAEEAVAEVPAATPEAPAAAASNEEEAEAESSAAARWLAEAAGKGSVPAWVAKSAWWAMQVRMKRGAKDDGAAARGVATEAKAAASKPQKKLLPKAGLHFPEVTIEPVPPTPETPFQQYFEALRRYKAAAEQVSS